MPKQGTPFPFPQPAGEETILLGEWWHADVEEIEKQGSGLGLPPNMSDAHTINGKPGPPNMSCQALLMAHARHGTYLTGQFYKLELILFR